MLTAPLPPGPRGHWFSGHLPEFRRDRLGFLTGMAREHGDMVRFRLGPRRICLVSHPDAIEEVLVHKARDFIKHFALRLNPAVLGNGLLTSESEFWLHQRRLIQPAFQRSRIAAYAPDMLAAADRVLGEWADGEARDIQAEMMRLTLDVTAKSLFDANIEHEARDVGAAMEALLESFLARFNSLLPLPRWIPTPRNVRFWRAIRRLDGIIYEFIRQRRESKQEKGDLLSILLRARDEDGRRMTDKQVRDEAMTLFLAGHETTALTLTWTWYLLAQNPEVEKKLVAEVEQVLQGRPPTADDLPRLHYVERVITESMRLLSPVYVMGREALREVEIGGFLIPKGTTLMMSQWVVQRDARWYDAPEEFRPERWEGEQAKRLPHFAYFPFGGGPRQCIGMAFALMESVLVLSRIAQRFRFTLVPEHPVVLWPTFTLRPRYGIKAVIRRR